MNDIIYAQKNVREAEYYEKKGEWENAAKYHKKSSKLFAKLIEGIDNEVDKEYKRLKEKHWKRYEILKKRAKEQETQKTNQQETKTTVIIPKSNPRKIGEENNTLNMIGNKNSSFENSSDDSFEFSTSPFSVNSDKFSSKAFSFPTHQNSIPVPLQKEKYVESKNREILIGSVENETNSGSYENLKNIIWKGLDLLINGIQGISYFSNSKKEMSLPNRNKSLPHTYSTNNNNKEKENKNSEKKLLENKIKKENQVQRYPSFGDGMQTVLLNSRIQQPNTVESLMEENEVLRKKIELLEAKNSKLGSLKDRAKQIVKENQILRDSFINMKNSLLVSSFDENSSKDGNENHLLSSFIDLLSSSVPNDNNNSNNDIHNNNNLMLKNVEDKVEEVNLLKLKIKSLEDKVDKQSKIIESYHQKWEDLKKSAKERREKKLNESK
eukprot:TRINITY_DN348_c0_g1_i1.p1 TRINITY_DN348_c0_g1~~TRINITY_DN348_c0_g1_i1.p1  ORF type:complete len:438 (-),score=172.00 TRINITY_DN348_c0_g1_i1:368-1681(-)